MRQSLKNEDAENIGYVIPPPVIHHFLDDFARNGKYTGFPGLGVEWQKMESPYLQKSMGMKVRPVDVLVFRGLHVCRCAIVRFMAAIRSRKTGAHNEQ